jgi:glyoxylase-like metal-dependent hydrolase (beta-lactamase superfamily II)
MLVALLWQMMAFHSLHTLQDDVVFNVEKLTDNAYVLYGYGGNIGVFVTENYLIVVDDQFERIAPNIKEELKKISDKPIRFLINTHHHGDHTGGNAFFKNHAVLVSHENARSRMDDDKKTEITYEKKMHLYPDGVKVELWHFGAGHTDGDTVVYIPSENVVHMGDLFFNKIFPYIDLGGGADTGNWMKTIDSLLATLPADVKIIPGHGKATSATDLKRFREYLRYCRAEVRKHLAEGKSLDDIKAGIDNVFTDFQGAGNFTSWAGNLEAFAKEAQ